MNAFKGTKSASLTKAKPGTIADQQSRVRGYALDLTPAARMPRMSTSAAQPDRDRMAFRSPSDPPPASRRPPFDARRSASDL